MQTLPAIAMEWVLIAFIAIVGLVVLYKILMGNIDLSSLLMEPPPPAPAAAPGVPVLPGKASMSRLQLLLFTFVIVGLYLTLSLEAGALIDIPNQVLESDS